MALTQSGTHTSRHARRNAGTFSKSLSASSITRWTTIAFIWKSSLLASTELRKLWERIGRESHVTPEAVHRGAPTAGTEHIETPLCNFVTPRDQDPKHAQVRPLLCAQSRELWERAPDVGRVHDHTCLIRVRDEVQLRRAKQAGWGRRVWRPVRPRNRGSRAVDLRRRRGDLRRWLRPSISRCCVRKVHLFPSPVVVECSTYR
jgi:hypothetical protein